MSLLPHIGQAWSLWPPYDSKGGLNIVADSEKIASDILSVLLIRRGEDPLHFYGIAPDLFEPLSNYDPQYFVYHAQDAILNCPWIAEQIESLSVDIIDYEDYKNRIKLSFDFVTNLSPGKNNLTFGYYLYSGVNLNQSVNMIIDEIQLNGQPFKALI